MNPSTEYLHQLPQTHRNNPDTDWQWPIPDCIYHFFFDNVVGIGVVVGGHNRSCTTPGSCV